MYGIVNDALMMRRDDEAASCCRWPKTGVDVSFGLRGVPISRLGTPTLDPVSTHIYLSLYTSHLREDHIYDAIP